MDGRRLATVVVALVAGGALVVFARPGGGPDDADPTGASDPPPGGAAEQPHPDTGQTDAGQPGAGPAQPGHGDPAAPDPANAGGSPDPADDAADGAGSPAAPHDVSGVTDEERLADADVDAVRAAAADFADAWSTPGDDWHRRLTPLATDALADALRGADPPQPAPQVTGGADLVFDAPHWARVAVPTDRGALLLDLVATDDGWRTAAIDWRPT